MESSGRTRKAEFKSLKIKSLILFCLILISNSFSLYGKTRLNIERTWNIDLEKDASVSFTANIGQNNTNQKILAISTEPKMSLNVDEGLIRVEYNASKIPYNSLVLKVFTDTEIEFTNSVDRNVQFVKNSPVTYTNLTYASSQMEQKAKELEDKNSDLKTIANLANWVHNNVNYDIAYWSKIIPAEQVYLDRRGVCVEYTHLFISLAKSLGFKVRYVNGYVYSGIEWQPHAWAEVKMSDGKYLAVDPTFGEVGKLDSYHYKIADGEDYQAVYDQILSNAQNINVKTNETIVVQREEKSQNLGISVDEHYDDSVGAEIVEITNGLSDYVFVTYDFVIQNDYGKSRHEILLLEPNQKITVTEKIDKESLKSGYEYSIPIRVLVDDIEKNSIIDIKTGIISINSKDESECKAAFILIFLFTFVEYYHKVKKSSQRRGYKR